MFFRRVTRLFGTLQQSLMKSHTGSNILLSDTFAFRRIEQVILACCLLIAVEICFFKRYNSRRNEDARLQRIESELVQMALESGAKSSQRGTRCALRS